MAKFKPGDIIKYSGSAYFPHMVQVLSIRQSMGWNDVSVYKVMILIKGRIAFAGSITFYSIEALDNDWEQVIIKR